MASSLIRSFYLFFRMQCVTCSCGSRERFASPWRCTFQWYVCLPCMMWKFRRLPSVQDCFWSGEEYRRANSTPQPQFLHGWNNCQRWFLCQPEWITKMAPGYSLIGSCHWMRCADQGTWLTWLLLQSTICIRPTSLDLSHQWFHHSWPEPAPKESSGAWGSHGRICPLHPVIWSLNGAQVKGHTPVPQRTYTSFAMSCKT